MSAKPPTKVALIWPDGLGRHLLPLPYAAITANTSKELCEFRLFDLAMDLPAPRDLARELAAYGPEVIGLTAHATNFAHALAAVKTARAAVPGAVVVAGGPHPSACPEGVLSHPEIDFVVRGEAEKAFTVFMEQYRSGAPEWDRVPGLCRRDGAEVKVQPAALVQDLDSLAFPDYKFIRLDEYLRRGYRLLSDGTPCAPIQTTRGCPHNCAFCGVAAVSGRGVRHYSLDYTLRWIRQLHRDFGIRWFNVIDDNFTHDVPHARRFCDAVTRLDIPGLKFGTPNGIRMQRGNAELWKDMKRAGWDCLTIAPESGSAEVLGLMQKGLLPQEVEPIVKEIRAAGLKLRGFFMIGYPGETRADAQKTLDLIDRCKLDFVELLFFQPLPGTPVFDKLVEKGDIPRDFLPEHFSTGDMRYVTPDLQDMNFPWLFLRVRIEAALRSPWTFLRYLDIRRGTARLIGQVPKILRRLLLKKNY